MVRPGALVTTGICPVLEVVMQHISDWIAGHIAEHRYGVKVVLFRVYDVTTLLTTGIFNFLTRFREAVCDIFEQRYVSSCTEIFHLYALNCLIKFTQGPYTGSIDDIFIS